MEGGLHGIVCKFVVSEGDYILYAKTHTSCPAANITFCTISSARAMGGCGVTMPSSFRRSKESELLPGPWTEYSLHGTARIYGS